MNVTHSGQEGRSYRGDRGIRGRVHVPGSTKLITATDGSWKAGTGGQGYVTRSGFWALSGRITKGRLNPIKDHGTGALVEELRAVGLALSHFPGRAQRFLIDSKAAISILESWQAGDVERMPQGYSLRPRIQGNPKSTLVSLAESISGREDLRFVHVCGHEGHAMNEVADSLAGIGRRAMKDRKGTEWAIAEHASQLVAGFLAGIHGDKVAP